MSAFKLKTLPLEQTTEVLHTEIEQRKRVEAALKQDIAERRAASTATLFGVELDR